MSNSGYGNDWFDVLLKPPFMPPGWAFGVVWPILYLLMGLALAMVLAEPPSPRRKLALTLFFVQLALNFAWSPIFFAAHDITLAKVVIFLMAVIAAAAAGQFLPVPPGRGAADDPLSGVVDLRRCAQLRDRTTESSGRHARSSLDNWGYLRQLGIVGEGRVAKAPATPYFRAERECYRCSPRTGCSTIS